ncbi:hypothetical protein KUCAC02_009525 [Chaenocephalus aceratus]|nr:hypothetical protein KUCAC02_009525 [Chaenocephalus aceratus]
MLAAARLTCPLNAPSLLPGMALRYFAARLLQLNNHSTPLCISAIKNHELLKRTKYIHRGSGRKFTFTQFTPSPYSGQLSAHPPFDYVITTIQTCAPPVCKPWQ